MSSPTLPTLIFQSLPATLGAQENLLLGLAAHAAFRNPAGFASAMDSYQLVADERKVLPPDSLSGVLDRVMRLPRSEKSHPLFRVENRANPALQPATALPSGSPAAPALRKSVPAVRASSSEGAAGAESAETPSDPLNEILERERVRLQLAYEQARTAMRRDEAEGWHHFLKDIEKRQEFWTSERLRLLETFGTHRARYESDIAIGEGILLDQIRRALADLLTRPEETGTHAAAGLRSRRALHKTASTESGRIVTALINRDAGFGPHLTLRDHQIATVRLFKGLLRRIKELERERSSVADEFLRGTVAMPQGGGKTRTMVASFAVAIQEGLFDARRGDKFVVLNHTDQIHGQNRKVMSLLNDYFVAKFGRPLKVSEYKADVKDLSGDVVIVSVPSVNSEERRLRFEKMLRTALGKQGSVPVAALDEVHHSDLAQERQDSWNKLVATIRSVSPRCFRLGFTATPTPKDRPFIRIRDLELMRAGVTPRTYVVKVQGTDLRRLKAPKDGNDFAAKELSSTLLDDKSRNRRIFETVEKQGLRWESPSPSGRERLKPTLYFGVDLKHARMMAEDYLEYFGTREGGLRGRRIALLGEDRGRISEESLLAALNDYREGIIDQVAAVVSGSTSPKVRALILEAAERGEIEAVFSVDLWYEGADLYMFSHIVGSRPTFSPYKKGQERGRPNRRSPKDVTLQGEILSDEPKIVFDVIDTYEAFDRALVTYGDVMNLMGYYEARPGQLFDAVAGAVREAVDRTGQGAVRVAFEPKIVPLPTSGTKSPRAVTVPDWRALAERLQKILDDSYAGDAVSMAEQLGISPEDLEGLLSGRGWEQRYDFLRRLATLLYQDRDAFVELYNDLKGTGDERLADGDLSLVKSALAAYEKMTGKAVEGGLAVDADAGFGRQKILINAYTINALARRTISERAWTQVAQALIVAFGAEALSGNEERRQEALRLQQSLIDRIFQGRGWRIDASTARGRLLQAARHALTVRAGGRLSVYHGIEGITKRWKSPDLVPLNNWLQGKPIAYSRSRTPKAHYEEVRALLLGLGIGRETAESLIVDAVFEEQSEGAAAGRSWLTAPEGARQELLFEARRRVALASGGRLLHDTGIPGLPAQTEDSVLSKWLRIGEVDFVQGVTRRDFYRQVRILLEGTGLSKAETREFIEKAVFEAEGWSRKKTTAAERLLLEARRLMAIEFGGRLTPEHGVPGVNDQRSGNPPINTWLAEGRFEYSRKVPPHVFYAQVRALLAYLSPNAEKNDALIVEAVYEDQGWRPEADTPLGRLLRRVRSGVALRFGGRLPAQPGIDGVPPQTWDYEYRGRHIAASPLTRWIRGDEIVFSRTLTAAQFARQVRALCAGLGIEGEIVEEALSKAA